MTLDVVNGQNEKVDSLELSDETFGGEPALGLVWEAVVHEQAKQRRGTHATKTRAQVSGTGRKPWRQKGTGRARVGSARNPIWRTGGVVFGPQPRDYGYRLPRKVARGALRAALQSKLAEGSVIVISAFDLAEPRTRLGNELLEALEVPGKALLVDVTPNETLDRAMRNLPGVAVTVSSLVTPRDLIDAEQVVVTKAAMEHLARAVTGSGPLRRAESPEVAEAVETEGPADTAPADAEVSADAASADTEASES